ncbi:hypothetical protein X797_008874 [Metarhizium robertsii]|uniref:Uncharacterized protein n=1 Tax=Metarhizium robertsii TaxID=568076 RepID=A0A014QW21_9HYPO|nr:hypothetical protein X797_008874 [Metarhizium robertsii]
MAYREWESAGNSNCAFLHTFPAYLLYLGWDRTKDQGNTYMWPNRQVQNGQLGDSSSGDVLRCRATRTRLWRWTMTLGVLRTAVSTSSHLFWTRVVPAAHGRSSSLETPSSDIVVQSLLVP